jgi:MFS family permease
MSQPDRSGRTLALLSLASLGWAFSFGLGAPLASLWLRDAGSGAPGIGLNTSFYYLGVAVASPFIPWLMGRANRACVVAGMSLDAVSTALFPWCGSVASWHALRFIAGVGTAMSLIPMETLINHNAARQHRARDFGIYAFCVALGIALGGVIGLPLYPVAPRLAFAVGGLVTLVAVAAAWPVVARSGSEAAGADDTGPVSWRQAALPLGTAWAQGFLEGGALTFLSIYLLWRGHDEAGAGALMGALFAGVMLAQLPLAWLADRAGRLRVLLACHGLLLAGLLLLPATRPALALGGGLFVLGACCGALYPLGLALLGERVPPAGMARANAWYLACNCAGSLSGPIVIGLAADRFGPVALFFTGAVAVVAVLAGSRVVPAMAPAAEQRRAA